MYLIRHPASDPARGWSYVLKMNHVYLSVVEVEAAHQFDTVEGAREAIEEMMAYPNNRRRLDRLRQAEAVPVDREGFLLPDFQPIHLWSRS